MSPILALAFAFAAIIVVGTVSAWLHDVLATRFGTRASAPGPTRASRPPRGARPGSMPAASVARTPAPFAPRRPARPVPATTLTSRRRATKPPTIVRPARPVSVTTRPLG